MELLLLFEKDLISSKIGVDAWIGLHDTVTVCEIWKLHLPCIILLSGEPLGITRDLKCVNIICRASEKNQVLFIWNEKKEIYLLNVVVSQQQQNKNVQITHFLSACSLTAWLVVLLFWYLKT